MAVINEEPGSAIAEEFFPGAAVSVFNVAEVVAKLSDYGMPLVIVEKVIAGLQLEIHDGDLAQALRNGELREVTRQSGLSLGDRACLALANKLGLPAVTADQIWVAVAEPANVEIILIR